MAAERGNTYISETMTDSVKIPTAYAGFLTMANSVKVSPNDCDSDSAGARELEPGGPPGPGASNSPVDFIMHEYLHKYFEIIKKLEIFFIRNMRPLSIREAPDRQYTGDPSTGSGVWTAIDNQCSRQKLKYIYLWNHDRLIEIVMENHVQLEETVPGRLRQRPTTKIAKDAFVANLAISLGYTIIELIILENLPLKFQCYLS